MTVRAGYNLGVNVIKSVENKKLLSIVMGFQLSAAVLHAWNWPRGGYDTGHVTIVLANPVTH